MAKGDSSSSTSSTPETQPQQNQYLTDNPATKPEANTSWMNPNDRNGNTGINGNASDVSQIRQQNQPLNDGTMLGQIAAGSYAPMVGWDSGKLNDPNKHDPKYDWARSVQNVGSNADLGKVVDYYNRMFGGNAKFLGTDKVDFGGDTGIIDTLFDQEGSRQNLWAPMSSNSGNNPSMTSHGFLGQLRQQPGPGMNINPIMNPSRMFQMKTGQQIPWDGGTNGINSGPNQQFDISSLLGSLLNPSGGMDHSNVMPPDNPQSNGLVWWPGMKMQPGVNY